MHRGPGRTRALLPLALLLTLAGCAAHRAAITPENRAAYYANQVVIRLEELQKTAIAANASGALSDAAAITVVKFTVAATRTVRDTPNGWLSTVQTLEAEVRRVLPASAQTTLDAAWTLLDQLLLTVKGSTP